MPLLDLPIADDYRPSSGELDNFVYLICKYTVGWQMRQADLQVCLMMAGHTILGSEGLSKLCEVTCEYLWDHICGEPDDFTPQTLTEHIKPLLEYWYQNSTPEKRAITEWEK